MNKTKAMNGRLPVPAGSGGGRVEQHVDQSEELHDALVLSQILVTFEQVPVIFAVRAVDLQPPRTLLGRDDVHRRRKRGDGDVSGRNAGHVVARHAQLQPLRVEQPGGDVLKLQGGERGELLVDALEDVVVQVPGLVQLLLAARLAILLAPVVRLLKPGSRVYVVPIHKTPYSRST